MKISFAGIELIKELEGFEPQAYQCSASVWTYGYGSTTTIAGNKVTQGMSITRALAEILLKGDITRFEEQVNRLVQVALTQNQFDALVLFTYNTGGGALEKSTLLKKLNNDKSTDEQIAAEFMKWVYAKDSTTGKKRKVQGLINRRKREKELFLSNDSRTIFRRIHEPEPNNTPLRNRDLPLPSGKLAIETRGVQPSDVAMGGTVAATGSIATIIADPQIITSALSFLQAVDWRVAIAVLVVAVGLFLWVRGRR